MKPLKELPSNRSVAYYGASLSVAAVLFYSILIMIYVITRSSLIIYRIMPDGERNTILWANAFSIAYSVAGFSLISSVISSAVGSAGSIILKKLLIRLNPGFDPRKSALIGCLTALLMISFIYLLLYAVLKDRMTVKYFETFLFWFLFPAIISFTIGVTGAIRLNTLLAKNRFPINKCKVSRS